MYGLKAVSRAPASCGELIQGTVKDREILVSYPINRYSIATATFGENRYKKLKPKVYMSVKRFLIKINRIHLLNNISITIDSHIPVGKGMASSTADMTAAVSAVAQLLDYPMDEDFLADILVQVEPTDSTVFKDLTLFEYKEGKFKEKLGDVPKFNILVLEGFGMVDTVKFNKEKPKLKSIDGLFETLKISITNKDLKLLGSVSTHSAIINQEILFKPYLGTLLELTGKYRALGINVAHSGTVCGVIYDDCFDLEQFKWDMAKLNYFERIYSVYTVPGSYQIL